MRQLFRLTPPGVTSTPLKLPKLKNHMHTDFLFDYQRHCPPISLPKSRDGQNTHISTMIFADLTTKNAIKVTHPRPPLLCCQPPLLTRKERTILLSLASHEVTEFHREKHRLAECSTVTFERHEDQWRATVGVKNLSSAEGALPIATASCDAGHLFVRLYVYVCVSESSTMVHEVRVFFRQHVGHFAS